MDVLPPPWDAYERLQRQSSKKTALDHHYWGVDAGMEALLEPKNAIKSVTPSEVERTIASAARQDRYRAQLRSVHLLREDQAPYGAGPAAEAAEAHELLQFIAEHVTPDDWDLLTEVACARNYAEIAAERNVSVGSLRVKVNRLRVSFRVVAF